MSLVSYLSSKFEEIDPIDFYRNIFPEGDMQEKGVYDYEDHKYNAILTEVTNKELEEGKYKILKHTVTDELDKIREVISRDNFCLMSPITYVGKERNSVLLNSNHI